MRPKDRLLFRGIPKAEIKTELEKRSDTLSICEHIATGTVAIGLVMGLGASMARFLPTPVYLWTLPYLQFARDFGESLVAIGVVAELVIGSKSGSVETALREENNLLIQESEGRIAELHTTAAQALERAATAEQAAAEANLARIKIEERLCTLGRRATLLQDAAGEKFGEAIKPLAGQKVELWFNPKFFDGDPETQSLCMLLMGRLQMSNWVTELKPELINGTGIGIFWHPTAPQSTKDAAILLAEKLSGAGLTDGANEPIKAGAINPVWRVAPDAVLVLVNPHP